MNSRPSWATYQYPVSKHQKRKKLLKLQLSNRTVAYYTQDSRFNPQVVPPPQINLNKNIGERLSPFGWVHTTDKPMIQQHSGRRQRQEDRHRSQASQGYIVVEPCVNMAPSSKRTLFSVPHCTYFQNCHMLGRWHRLIIC